MASAKVNLAFTRDFQKKVMTYLEIFLEMDEEMDREPRERRRGQSDYTEEQAQALISRFQSQREVVTKMFDRARAIAEEYAIHEEFHTLLSAQPGEMGEWGRLHRINDKFLRDLNDTFVRLISVLENAPPLSETRRVVKTVWRWLDDRSIAKWIVVAVFVLGALAVLKRLGYDLPGLIGLMKAIRGDK